MKRTMYIFATSLALGPALAMAEEQSSIFDGGWRVSAGAVYDSGVKTDFHFAPQQTYVTPFSRTPGSLSRKQAQEQGNGQTVGTRTYFVDANGNRSWVDSNDTAPGYDAGKTRYYSFAQGSYNADGSFTLGEADFEEMSVEQSAFSSMEFGDRDERAMPGINVQLSRNLYHDDENSWGVEASFAFQYARRNDVIKSASSWKIGSSSKTTGKYVTRYAGANDSTLGDLLSAGADFLWHPGTVGDWSGTVVGQSAETSDDAAIPIDLGDVEKDWGESTQRDVAYGALQATGDYENMEMMLLLQPYYDIFDWMSVNATIGAVASRQSLDMSLTMLRNGRIEYRSDDNYSQWDVYGIAGLGLMFYYEGVTLSGDFMARFLDDEMTISNPYYRGSVERGPWMFRIGLGYEF